MTKIGSKEAQMRAMREGRATVAPEKKQQAAREALAKATSKKSRKTPQPVGTVQGKTHIMPTDSVVSLLATKASAVKGMPVIQRDAAYSKNRKRESVKACQKPYIPAKYGIIGRIVEQMDAARGDVEKLRALGDELDAQQNVRTYYAMAARFRDELVKAAKSKE